MDKEFGEYYYEWDEVSLVWGIWQSGGTFVEDAREVDTLLFHVVDKIDAQTACELLNKSQTICNEDDGQPDELQEWHDFDPDC